MLKMVWLIFFQLMFLGLSGATQESAQVLTLFETSHEVFQGSNLPIAVSVRELSEVSTSVLMAETWLRTHVLGHYPSIPITTILVGDTILCSEHHNNLSLVLLALKNIHHSLTRWGLEKDIKVSAAFSSGCLGKSSERFVRPILEFLQDTNSTYSVNPPPKVSPFSDETIQLVSSHSETLKKLGFLGLRNINVIVTNPKEAKPRTRKLSSIDPFPTRPNPQPITSDPPLHSSVGFSVPANVAKNPQPPQAQLASPAPSQTASPPIPETASPPVEMWFPHAPEVSPVQATPSPSAYVMPPCRAPAPEFRPVHKLWCVAKPTVPAETLQEAVDYACGAGGADCEEIMPSGNCYYPESVVAHASYAFNSYWQKNKRNGGTCSFGGTAMLINSDPSYELCRFIIT
ncbi:PREDICTED: glucan endo-1,3-beta-glucosidase 13 [Fragaria vesca subsp. vesca]|uniref:glucan endo-1,3-beta-glucosidase 13 n=1 Tax=Fragaria vesca subsp. vesca TaxID=101020 RepID=UPI0002C342C9|nr:PREDICTED: glucan endo-1,3-beta-glucosidase 13 [Fragaria vesca subsp. vesca]